MTAITHNGIIVVWDQSQLRSSRGAGSLSQRIPSTRYRHLNCAPNWQRPTGPPSGYVSWITSCGSLFGESMASADDYKRQQDLLFQQIEEKARLALQTRDTSIADVMKKKRMQ